MFRITAQTALTAEMIDALTDALTEMSEGDHSLAAGSGMYLADVQNANVGDAAGDLEDVANILGWND